jgi:hypothetical protein
MGPVDHVRQPPARRGISMSGGGNHLQTKRFIEFGKFALRPSHH